MLGEPLQPPLLRVSHRRVSLDELPADVNQALVDLKRALARVPYVQHAQVTLDQVTNPEHLPTVDVIAWPPGDD